MLDEGEIRVAAPTDTAGTSTSGPRRRSCCRSAPAGWRRSRSARTSTTTRCRSSRGWAEKGVRVVPPATARQGAYIAPGVVLMPSYVNVGAWVGSGTMVDTWATVGSCAQIGTDVHLSGGVGIGGVLEPLQASPVIVEDGAFVGSRCIVVEGVAIGREAVLGANVVDHVLDADHRRPRREAGRAARRGAAPRRRRARDAQEGVPGRQVPRAVRADHRRALGLDGPQDLTHRGPARTRRQRLTARPRRPARPSRSGRRGGPPPRRPRARRRRAGP